MSASCRVPLTTTVQFKKCGLNPNLVSYGEHSLNGFQFGRQPYSAIVVKHFMTRRRDVKPLS